MDLVFVFWRHYTCHSRKQKFSNKMTGPGGPRKETSIVLTSWALQRQCSRMFTLVPPTDAMMLGSGHFQDHRAVVLDFSNVEMTGPQVARQYRTAICDRQLLLQKSVQCSLQQWWQATPGLPQASPRIKVMRSWRSGCVVVSAPWHPQTKKKPKQPWMDRATLDQVLSESSLETAVV